MSILVIVHSYWQVANDACSAVASLLEWDLQGDVSLEAVQQIARMVKAKQFNVRPQVCSDEYYYGLIIRIGSECFLETTSRTCRRESTRR